MVADGITGGFEIKQHTTVAETLEKGSVEQKAAAKIFDFNGDGEYSLQEAESFNSSIITVNGDNITTRTGDFEVTQSKKDINQDYKYKTANYQKNFSLLRQFGLNAKEILDDVGEKECLLITDKSGKQILMIKSPDVTLRIPIDKNYNPSNIRISSNLQNLENINATIIFNKDFALEDGVNIYQPRIGGNSNVHIIGSDKTTDRVIIADNASVTFKTGDNSDAIIVEGANGELNNHRLDPGQTKIKATE